MIDNLFFFTLYALIFLFGIVLSFAFCGLHFTKKNNIFISLIFVILGIGQLAVFSLFGELRIWELYPFIVHLPIGVILCLAFKKKIVTVIAAISLSYLCCQPSKWVGLLADEIIENDYIVTIIRIIITLIVVTVIIRYFALYIFEIFNKDNRSVLIFSSIPMIYYLFDYTVNIYTNLWNSHYRVISEFLAFFLCVVFFAFCIVYYKEYEKKIEFERKEQIIDITVQQQEKEIAAIKKSNLETRLIRHDMRLLLSNLALSIEKGDKENSLKMISGFVEQIENSPIKRYCENDTVNYVLTNFESRFRKADIDFQVTVEMGKLTVDEILFSSIISNALDNALNAQKLLSNEERQVKLLLKDSDGKLLLSVKNPFNKKQVFIDGLPVSDRKEHGYGTQSIRYLTEKLGGKSQFVVQNNIFILRVVI